MFGGKAQSLRVPDEQDSIAGLPCEHGFRFFPGVYTHVVDTMDRIRPSVKGHLVETQETVFTREDGKPLVKLVDLGIAKKIWDDKGEVKLRFGDILHTAGWKGENVFTPGLKMNARGTWESRIVALNFSYRFGSSEVKGKA